MATQGLRCGKRQSKDGLALSTTNNRMRHERTLKPREGPPTLVQSKAHYHTITWFELDELHELIERVKLDAERKKELPRSAAAAYLFP
jgi:hypothetical protein